MVDIKPGDSGVVIRYQIDDFTHTWSLECFIAKSHIYPGFTDKVSKLNHFPLEPSCEDYSFFDQEVEDFKESLDSILMESIDTPGMDPYLDEADAMPSSVSSGFIYFVSTGSDTSILQFAPSIKSCKLWCRLGL